MVAVSDAYRTAIRARSRTERLCGTLTLTDGTVLDIGGSSVMQDSVTVDNQCVTGEELMFGCVYLGQAALQIRTNLSRYAFYNATLVLGYELLLPDGSWERVPLGTFTVAEAERKALYVSVKAYDNIIKLERRYDGVALQGTAYDILSQIASACGLELGQTQAELEALNPNATVVRQLDSTYRVTTWRDCVSAVAQLLAGFATVDRAGRLVIRQFAAAASATLDKSARTEAGISDFSCHYIALHIQTDKGELTSATDSATGLAMTITNMPLAESGLDSVKQSICDNVFSVLSAIQYTPADIKMPGDPSIELGDRITLPGDTATAETLCTHWVWKFHGTQTIKGVGKNPYLYGTTSQTETFIRDLQQQATANKLIYYSFTNRSALTVSGDKEVIAAHITFVTTQDTSAMFLAQLLLTADPDTEKETLDVVYDTSTAAADSTESTTPAGHITLTKDAALTLTVRYYMDGTLIESFTPAQTLVRGSHTMALFYPFPELVGAASHTWSVRLVCGGGTVHIDKEQLKATITGQGMASGEIWDGTITLEDSLTALTVASAPKLAPISDQMTTEVQAPVGPALTEMLSAITLTGSRIQLAGLTDDGPAIAEAVESWTLTTQSNATYSTEYVTTASGAFALRTEYIARSSMLPIDTGLCAAVTVDTGPYVSIERIEVK